MPNLEALKKRFESTLNHEKEIKGDLDRAFADIKKDLDASKSKGDNNVHQEKIIAKKKQAVLSTHSK